MEFDDLQALLWLYRHGSLQAAARASGVARTTLRRRLDRLESSLGRTLVTSDASGLQLTPAGRVLVERGPDLVTARDVLARDARTARASTDTLQILLPLGIPPRLVAQVLAALSGAMPDIQLRIDFDPDPLQRLRETFDVVLHWGDAPQVQDGFTRELIRAPLTLQASPSYLQAAGVPRSLEDLRGHSVLHWSGQRTAWPLVDGGEHPYEPTHETTDLYVLGCMAGAGLGLALIPAEGIALDSSIVALQTVLPDQVAGELCLRLYVPQPTVADSPSAVLASHIDEIRAQIMALVGG